MPESYSLVESVCSVMSLPMQKPSLCALDQKAPSLFREFSFSWLISLIQFLWLVRFANGALFSYDNVHCIRPLLAVLFYFYVISLHSFVLLLGDLAFSLSISFLRTDFITTIATRLSVTRYDCLGDLPPLISIIARWCCQFHCACRSFTLLLRTHRTTQGARINSLFRSFRSHAHRWLLWFLWSLPSFLPLPWVSASHSLHHFTSTGRITTCQECNTLSIWVCAAFSTYPSPWRPLGILNCIIHFITLFCLTFVLLLVHFGLFWACFIGVYSPVAGVSLLCLVGAAAHITLIDMIRHSAPLPRE